RYATVGVDREVPRRARDAFRHVRPECLRIDDVQLAGRLPKRSLDAEDDLVRRIFGEQSEACAEKCVEVEFLRRTSEASQFQKRADDRVLRELAAADDFVDAL